MDKDFVRAPAESQGLSPPLLWPLLIRLISMIQSLNNKVAMIVLPPAHSHGVHSDIFAVASHCFVTCIIHIIPINVRGILFNYDRNTIR